MELQTSQASCNNNNNKMLNLKIIVTTAPAWPWGLEWQPVRRNMCRKEGASARRTRERIFVVTLARCMCLGKILQPRFYFLIYNNAINSCFTRLMWRLHNMTYAKCTAQCPGGWNKWSLVWDGPFQYSQVLTSMDGVQSIPDSHPGALLEFGSRTL